VIEIFDRALSEVGADYFGVLFLPRPEERLVDCCLAQKLPADWCALYSAENFFQRDPPIRHCRRTILPFDWASAPYEPEREPHMAEIMERARDFRLDKGLMVPIPSPNGIVGCVGVTGAHFDERKIHMPVVHSLALHVFNRLQRLSGKRSQVCGLTNRQRDVLAWGAEGKTAWEIGCILNISQRTVETYFHQACKKLGAANRIQAIAIWLGAEEGSKRG
jgi:LuxR family quorum sensing-dependent transcriptional regulator